MSLVYTDVIVVFGVAIVAVIAVNVIFCFLSRFCCCCLLKMLFYVVVYVVSVVVAVVVVVYLIMHRISVV